MRLIATGAAPLKPDILQFFRAALGAVVFEVRNASVYLSFSILPDQRPLLRVCCFPLELSYKSRYICIIPPLHRVMVRLSVVEPAPSPYQRTIQ